MNDLQIERLADEHFAAHCKVYGLGEDDAALHIEIWHHAFRHGMNVAAEPAIDAAVAAERGPHLTMTVTADMGASLTSDGCTIYPGDIFHCYKVAREPKP